jgi:hypothetical protein
MYSPSSTMHQWIVIFQTVTGFGKLPRRGDEVLSYPNQM